ncbi:MAG: hypothetical protein JWN18_474, partial [Parcubacteria group bacterium]|nr:hypothetical protein [Parcubacteria group bacterium]
RVEGMFALAIYDSKEQVLTLARDRMGEKPLYVATHGRDVLFASELKALFEAGIEKNINLTALSLYLQHDYVPTPYTLIEGVEKVEPGTLLMFKNGGRTKKKFWNPPTALSPLSFQGALAKLDEELTRCVSQELMADVPIGVFLSGGLDSSTIAYYGQKARAQPINTYSIGFSEPSFDESKYARQVAVHLGTNHHEHIVSAKDALDLVPTLAETLSEPIADASVIPTMLLSKFARTGVTVALGGDGGDELFAGYPTFQADTASTLFRSLPTPLQSILRSAADLLPTSDNDLSLAYKLQKFASSIETDALRRHLAWLGTFSGSKYDQLVADRMHHAQTFLPLDAYLREFDQADSGNQLLWTYARTYLMDQVLVKVDRASMHYALETRAPFLDHKVVELAFSLPYSYKYRAGTTKYLLKKLMEDKLPKDIVYRKKKGFGIPLARWLSGPLRPLCEELLSARSLGAHGLFNAQEVSRLKDEHMAGKRDNRKELWNLMVFQMWHRQHMQ